MNVRDDSIRAVCPLFLGEGGGSTPTSSLQLHLGEISLDLAIDLVALWHSRLPKVDKSNMVRTKHLWCLGAEYGGRWHAVAIWTNPVARAYNGKQWLELRRLAIAPDAPKNAASRLIAVMTKLARRKFPRIRRLISYQDTAVHTGAIYAAAGWTPYEAERVGDWNRPNRRRAASQALSAKVRWEKVLRVQADELEAVRALLKAEDVPHRVWEPACGPGSIVRVLRDSGHDVLATDLVDYGTPEQNAAGVDFLIPGIAEAHNDGGRAIVTNPPFKNAHEFVERALHLSPYVAMLLRLAFLESEKRRSILDSGRLSRVHVFRNRLPMMHREGWTGPKASSATPFAWFIWDRSHTGPTVLSRISWEAA